LHIWENTFLILYATTTLASQFGLVQASALAALFYIIRNLVYAASSFPIGYLGDDVEFDRRGFVDSSLEGLATMDGPDVHIFYITTLGGDVFQVLVRQPCMD
jgi:hypothetical protein